MVRVHIFVDGANFYHLTLKKLGVEDSQFDFDEFAHFLANGRIVPNLGKRFYIGTVREKEGDVRTKEAMAKQTSLFAKLKNGHWEIKTSKLVTRIEEIVIDGRVEDFQKIRKLGINKIRYERLREKGVDVKMATDLIVGAIDDRYDIAVLVSSDSDLIPAVDWVRSRGKKVEYVGFSIPDDVNYKSSTNPSLSLIKKTNINRILVASDLQVFVKNKLLNSKID